MDRFACIWIMPPDRHHFYACLDKAAILHADGHDVWLGLDHSLVEDYRFALKETGVPWTSDVATGARWLREETACVAVALGTRARRKKALFPEWPTAILDAFRAVPVRASLLETPHPWGAPRVSVVRTLCNAAFCPCEEHAEFWRKRKPFRGWEITWGTPLHEPFWTNLPTRAEARARLGVPANAVVACLPHRVIAGESPSSIVRAIRKSGVHLLATGRPGGKRMVKALWEFAPGTRDDSQFTYVSWQSDPRPMIAAADFAIVLGCDPYVNLRGSDWEFLFAGKPLLAHADKRQTKVGRELEETGAGILVDGSPGQMLKAVRALARGGHGEAALAFGQRWNGLQVDEFRRFVTVIAEEQMA